MLLFRQFAFMTRKTVLVFLLSCSSFLGQSVAPPRTLITQVVSDAQRITLGGNTSPRANAANDRGPVANSMPMQHVWLQLKRPPEQQAALDAYAKEVSDPNSPYFHKWISAAQFGSQFGLNAADVRAVTEWLESQGLKVDGVAGNGTLISFSGSAGQVSQAFHTSIHQLQENGETHFSNTTDPQIPAALAQAVAGIVKLNNFMPHPLHSIVAGAKPNFSDGTGNFIVVPQDLATIYNFNPLFRAGYTGKGQTIVAIEDSDVYSASDWAQFRKLFGLTRPYGYGSFGEIHPSSAALACDDPGVNGDDLEASVDAQWASAAAPNANIVLASCANTDQFGGFIAMQNLLDSATPPAIISISFGGAENQQTDSENAYINALYQQAVVEGVSVFVAAGDAGADNNTDDRKADVATHGISANAFASTIYDVAVGGTDFGDAYLGETGQYWSSTNTPFGGSALSYIPEIPWNGSCGSSLIANYLGFPTPYGANGLCNSSTASQYGLLTVAAGGGAPSSIYAKPYWQSVFGNPADTVRDLPDVSLFAATGTWGHYYGICNVESGESCAQGAFYGVGGTSLSSPVMAGIQALINQKTGDRSGNPNPVLYNLARKEYGSSGNEACDSTRGNAIGADCIFHDVTLGDNDILCRGTIDCFTDGAANGVLSVSSTSFKPAYRAGRGWDFASGLGSVNAYQLVMSWPASPGLSAKAKRP